MRKKSDFSYAKIGLLTRKFGDEVGDLDGGLDGDLDPRPDVSAVALVGL